MANNFDYQFNVGGNYTAMMDNMSSATGSFSAAVDGVKGGLTSLEQKFAAFELISGYFERLSGTIDDFSRSGIALDTQMHDLSAIAGVTGKTLEEIEGYARTSAKTFGIDAAQAVEGYKLLLSQLTPELAKCPAALKAMGENIATTSKLMGGDGVAAAEVLTTAINQYGISLEDPIAASEKMAQMMNVMAAAGQAGSAELPAIKAALEQCGMAAKAANVSFEETNAAIQVLDKSGKKASEGGVALRNVLAIMGQGRFLPKGTQAELAQAGVDVIALADTSKGLKERLEMLKPVMNDSALFSKLFGMENANAARALVQGTQQLDAFTVAVTGTSSAEEQAAIVMDSYAERQARINQRIEDAKISLFGLTGDFGIYASIITQSLVPISQLVPLFFSMGKAMTWIKGLQWASMWSKLQGAVYVARIQMAYMNKELITGQFASNGFLVNIARATLAVARFATVGLFNAVKGLGALVASLVTGGATSATFAGIASGSFLAFKTAAVTACRAVGVAIMNIPIIGWIAAAIAAIAALFAYFWKTSAKFRGVIKGIGAYFVAIFKGMWDVAKDILGGIANAIWKCVSFQWDEVGDELKKIGGSFASYGKAAATAFTDAYKKEVEAVPEPDEPEVNPIIDPNADPNGSPVVVPTVTPDPTGGTLGNPSSSVGAGGGSSVKNVTVNVDKLVERFEIHTNNLSTDMGRVKEMVSEALLSALNDVNLAV